MSQIPSITNQTYVQQGSTSSVPKKDHEIQVFNFGGDRNCNGVVDQEDFYNNETYQLFQEKGLIGKAWDAIKQNAGKIFGLKSVSAHFENYNQYGEKLAAEEVQEFDNDGKLVLSSSLYEGTDAMTGKSYLAGSKVVYNRYDENGNPISATQYKLTSRGEEVYSNINITNEYDSQGNFTVHREELSGPGGSSVSVEYNYDKDGNLVSLVKGVTYTENNTQQKIYGYEYNESGRVIARNTANVSLDKDGVLKNTPAVTNTKFNYVQNDGSTALDSSETIGKSVFYDDGIEGGFELIKHKYKPQQS